MYYFEIITSVMMPRDDLSETNCPYLRVGCHNVHSAEKTWYTRHVHFLCQSTYATRWFLRAVPVRGKFSRCLNKVGRIRLLPKKRNSRLHPQPVGWSIYGSPPSFSLLTVIEVVGLSQASVDKHATSVYWAHNYSMWLVHSILARGGQPISP
jgi:hypothetical protein